MKTYLALFAGLSMTALAACDDKSAPSDTAAIASQNVTATGATVRLNPNPEAPAAAYFTLNGGTNDAVLIGASSSDLERAELHESRMDGGMMTMAPIARLPIPAGEQVVFRQGGKHVMLFGISAAARTRGTLTLNLDFADGPDALVVLAFPPQQAAVTGPPPALAAPSAPTEMDHSAMDHGDHEH